MLEAILIIFVCQLAGEGLCRFLGLSIPGPVVGMVILGLGLLLRDRLKPDGVPISQLPLGVVTGFLLANLSLLFVPAGVGIIAHVPTLVAHGPGLIIALVISTVVSLIVTAQVFVALSRRMGREQGQ